MFSVDMLLRIKSWNLVIFVRANHFHSSLRDFKWNHCCISFKPAYISFRCRTWPFQRTTHHCREVLHILCETMTIIQRVFSTGNHIVNFKASVRLKCLTGAHFFWMNYFVRIVKHILDFCVFILLFLIIILCFCTSIMQLNNVTIQSSDVKKSIFQTPLNIHGIKRNSSPGQCILQIPLSSFSFLFELVLRFKS